MTPLVVTVTPLYVVEPLAGVSTTGVDLTIDLQEALTAVVDVSSGVTVTLQGGEVFAPIVVDGDESVVTLTYDGQYTANVVEGEPAVAIFAGIAVGPGITDSFETVNRNLKAYPATLNYDVTGRLQSVFYDLGLGLSITKQLNYVSGALTTIVLSGDVPAGISLMKTLGYTSGRLTGITYS